MLIPLTVLELQYYMYLYGRSQGDHLDLFLKAVEPQLGLYPIQYINPKTSQCTFKPNDDIVSVGRGMHAFQVCDGRRFVLRPKVLGYVKHSHRGKRFHSGVQS